MHHHDPRRRRRGQRNPRTSEREPECTDSAGISSERRGLKPATTFWNHMVHQLGTMWSINWKPCGPSIGNHVVHQLGTMRIPNVVAGFSPRSFRAGGIQVQIELLLRAK